MRKSPLPVCMAMLVLASCSHTIPETSSKPVPPPQLGKTPPVIQPLSAGQKQTQAPESLLPVTLTADLTPIQRTIQTALPEQGAVYQPVEPWGATSLVDGNLVTGQHPASVSAN